MRRTQPPRSATALRGWASSTHYGLRIGVPNWERHRAVGRLPLRPGPPALPRARRPSDARPLPARLGSRGRRAGRRHGPPLRARGGPEPAGQVNVLWQISHPDLATPALYDRYDHVFVASDPFAARMADSCARAGDPAPPGHRPRAVPARPERPAPRAAVRRQLPARPAAHRRRPAPARRTTSRSTAGLAPDIASTRASSRARASRTTELARYYSSASIVLNDHWDDMRDEGFISNRIYDALACGAFVISDRRRGHRRRVRRCRRHLSRRRPTCAPSIDRYLADPDERREARRARPGGGPRAAYLRATRAEDPRVDRPLLEDPISLGQRELVDAIAA